MRTTVLPDEAIPMLSKTESAVICAAALLLGLLLAWHLFALMIYNMPGNPLTVMPAVSRPVDRYVEPYLSQAWNFFAPNPVDRDLEGLYRLRYRGPRGRVMTTPWVSMNASLDQVVRYDWLSRAMVVRGSVWASLDDFANNRFGQREKRADGTADIDSFPYDLVALERTAMAMSRGQLDRAGATRFQVQIATIARRYPRFSHRYDATDPAREAHATVLFPWVRGETVAAFAAE